MRGKGTGFMKMLRFRHSCKNLIAMSTTISSL